MNIELYSHQIDALGRMKNGCILNGAVGSGKSRTGLMYYYIYILHGSMRVNGKGKYKEPQSTTPLYIITTAKKRDSKDWEQEMLPFLLSTDQKLSIKHILVVVDSWNNIKKYEKIKNSFFIFDEDRVTGSGVWAKTFIKLAKTNKWILLSGTPGDNFLDYRAVFIANGFYKNKTDFNNQHVVWENHHTFWAESTKRFMNTKKLERLKSEILIPMEDHRPTVCHNEKLISQYDPVKYKTIMKTRWDPYANQPIENVSKLCYLLRRVCSEDESRIDTVRELVSWHDRCVIFYNFDYELEILEKLATDLKIPFAQWNGHKHEEIPKKERWLYFCQYSSASEGWNCTSTDTMIFYSLNYSYKMMVQASGRINRMNTPYRDLYYYYIRSNAPIDVAIMKALKNKKKFNERSFVGV